MKGTVLRKILRSSSRFSPLSIDFYTCVIFCPNRVRGIALPNSIWGNWNHTWKFLITRHCVMDVRFLFGEIGLRIATRSLMCFLRHLRLDERLKKRNRSSLRSILDRGSLPIPTKQLRRYIILEHLQEAQGYIERAKIWIAQGYNSR